MSGDGGLGVRRGAAFTGVVDVPTAFVAAVFVAGALAGVLAGAFLAGAFFAVDVVGR